MVPSNLLVDDNVGDVGEEAGQGLQRSPSL